MTDESSKQDRIIGVEEAARRLFLSQRTVAKRLQSGEIEGWKTGRKWAMFESDIEKHLIDLQPTELAPMRIDRARHIVVSASQSEHLSNLLSEIAEFRNGVDYLLHQTMLDTWVRGTREEITAILPNRVTSRSIQQHLDGTSQWESYERWKACCNAVIKQEAIVYRLAIDVAERVLELPFVPYGRNRSEPDQISPGFVALAVSVAREYSAGKSVQESTHLSWADGVVQEVSWHLVRSSPDDPDELLDLCRRVLAEVAESQEGERLRRLVDECRPVIEELEDELDGLETSKYLPGTCQWCPTTMAGDRP